MSALVPLADRGIRPGDFVKAKSPLYEVIVKYDGAGPLPFSEAEKLQLLPMMDAARDAAIAVLDGTARPALSPELEGAIRGVVAAREDMTKTAGELGTRPFALIEARQQLGAAVDALRTIFQKEFGDGQQ